MSDVVIDRGVSFEAPDVDGCRPNSVVVPSSVAELCEEVAKRARDGEAMIPIGCGQRLGIGNMPRAYDTAVSLAGLHGVVEYQPADMVITVEAGMLASEMQGLLAESGQFLPLDQMGEPGTIGGLLGANSFGALRHRFGTARDWLLGLTVVNGEGVQTRSGGKVVKNVSGYDLHKLHVGALGSLGIIVEATFKVAPLARHKATLVVRAPSLAAGESLCNAVDERGLSLASMELVSPSAAVALDLEAAWTVVLDVIGGERTMSRCLRDIHDLAGLAGADCTEADRTVWDGWRSLGAGAGVAMRISVAPSVCAAVAEILDRRFTGNQPRLTVTASAGLVRLFLEPRDTQEALSLIAIAQAIADRHSGLMMVDAAPADVKADIDVFGPPRSDAAIMQKLKHQFDPHGVFAPGRYAGKI